MLSIVFFHEHFTSVISFAFCFDMLFHELRFYHLSTSQGRSKVCVQSTLARPHLWDYTVWYVVVVDGHF